MNKIHKTAIVDEEVTIGSHNVIGPNVVIENGVTIGSRNHIHPGVVIFKGTTIGDGNVIHTGAVLGDIPQDIGFEGTDSYLVIGSGNRIREYCTIHRGTKASTSTVIGDDNFLMGYTHVAHNCRIGSGIVTVNTAVLGGYVTVEDKAFISASVVIHQHCRVGTFAMVSGLSAVNQDVPPYMTAGGRPARVFSLNSVGLRRGGFSPEVRTDIKRVFKLLYKSGLRVKKALEEIATGAVSPEVKYFVDFCRSTERGITSGSDKQDYTM